MKRFKKEKVNYELQMPTIQSPKGQLKLEKGINFANITLKTTRGRVYEKMLGQILSFKYKIERKQENKKTEKQISSFHFNRDNLHSSFNVDLQKKEDLLFRVQHHNLRGEGEDIGNIVLFFDYSEEENFVFLNYFLDYSGILGNFVKILIPQIISWLFVSFSLWELLGDQFLLSFKFHFVFVLFSFLFSFFQLDSFAWNLLIGSPFLNHLHSYTHFVYLPSLFIHSIHLIISISLFSILRVFVYIFFSLFWVLRLFFGLFIPPLRFPLNDTEEQSSKQEEIKKIRVFEFFFKYLVYFVLFLVLSFFVHIVIIAVLFLLYLAIPETKNNAFETSKIDFFCRILLSLVFGSLDLIVWIRSILDNGYDKRECFYSFVIFLSFLFSIFNIIFFKQFSILFPNKKNSLFSSFFKPLLFSIFTLLYCMVSFGRLQYLIFFSELYFFVQNVCELFNNTTKIKDT